jgi:membrane protein DedA with SNARE-associated domain
MTTEGLVELLRADGLMLLFPLAVVEGPIVTVVAGWLVHLSVLSAGWTFLVLIIADLIGDSVLYAVGRSGKHIVPQRWQGRLGITDARLEQISDHFDQRGGSTLILAKVTHSFGFAALLAAGTGRMPFLSFLWFNLVGTIPKTAALLFLGYALGSAHQTINAWIGRGSLVILALGLVVLGGWLWYRKRQQKGHRT